ncbi:MULTISPECIES: hypothetical protein [unclassified Sphingomonas]|uniref:hypothetical protein n=1 Tax=unclassified Sphingomonas TaxID=196159 RepID=UPI000BDA1F50|nr:MAG: hypothetical protein B7Y98_11730 [Sphingomonas sp. 32-62-10]
MKTLTTIALMAAATIGLAACSPTAQNETAEAAEAITADANATMGEAINDTEAAADQVFGAAENAIDRAGQKIGNVADAAGNEIEE